MAQTIISAYDSCKEIEKILNAKGCKKYLLVCGSSFKNTFMMEYLQGLQTEFSVFSGFTPNPDYSEVCAGVAQFNNEDCDAIIAAGGGSAIDVAKCIKLFCRMNPTQNFLEQEFTDTKIPLIAVPTTAGTGSESTRFSVIYYKGEKQSVHHDNIVPDFAILEPRFLKTLPVYQKKCTMMDALCQAIESWWSVHSTDESKRYAKNAIELIVKYGDEYIFDNTDKAAEKIMQASNLAGQAINITATTAPHAMSYKLTSLYGLPHGHSVAISLLRVWNYMINHPELCTDKRGKDYLIKTFSDIGVSLGANSHQNPASVFGSILDKYKIADPVSQNKDRDLSVLASSVNVERLGNNPVSLSYDALCGLYDSILKEGKANGSATQKN